MSVRVVVMVCVGVVMVCVGVVVVRCEGQMTCGCYCHGCGRPPSNPRFASPNRNYNPDPNPNPSLNRTYGSRAHASIRLAHAHRLHGFAQGLVASQSV